MSTAWERLANEPILDIHPYQPGKPIEELERELGIPGAVKLASNENPFPPPPAWCSSPIRTTRRARS